MRAETVGRGKQGCRVFLGSWSLGDAGTQGNMICVNCGSEICSPSFCELLISWSGDRDFLWFVGVLVAVLEPAALSHGDFS